MLNHIGTQTIETKRLILRRFKVGDAQAMYDNWASDDEVTKHLSWPTHGSVEVTQGILNHWIESYENNEFYQWAMELKEEKVLIGTISLISIDNDNENAEVGYCMGKAWWNQGMMSEALQAVIKVAFSDLTLSRLMARHNVDNPASGCVMEKCGLLYEGTQRKVAKNNQGELVDCKYYAILKEDYLA